MSEERKNCSECDELISARASVCPFCRSETAYARALEIKRAEESAQRNIQWDKEKESEGLVKDRIGIWITKEEMNRRRRKKFWKDHLPLVPLIPIAFLIYAIFSNL